MKITDLRCAVIGNAPIVRIVTDEGISGYGQVELYKPTLAPIVMMLAPALIGQDPTNVERVMKRIRARGGFKPWGAAVSAVEMALWDVAGKAAGLPVYKLLGGRVRDRVRVYNGAYRGPITESTPDGYAAAAQEMKDRPEGFTIQKMAVGFHSRMPEQVPNFFLGDVEDHVFHGVRSTGLLTESGLAHVVACVEAAKEVFGDEIGLALDCGPGWALSDAMRFSRAVDHLNLMWLEDLLTGDYSHWVNPDVYLELTRQSVTPIHTGEQIYLRQNFKALIESHAVNVVGPDPGDVGGIAELKWVAEYADLHGIMIAPHGTGNGLFGMAALVQVCATLPDNFMAFECPIGNPSWWYDLIAEPGALRIVDGFIEVPDRPGMGIEFNVEAAKARLSPEDAAFFD
jgi:L-alanine-DL-glutamate epimerase-like enolase superfamily enzyme